MPNLRLSAVVPALALVFLLAACERSEPVPPKAVRPVRTVVAEASAVESALSLPGELRPRVEVAYGFRVGGKIARREVAVGDRVKAGQVLARLDPTDAAPAAAAAQATLSGAQTEERLAQADLDRQLELRERNFISEASLDRSRAAHDAAAARVAAAQAQLRQARNAVDFQVLRADVSGYVASIAAEAGQVVAAGQPVVRVARAGEIEVAISIPEARLAAARSVGRWQVRVAAVGDRVFDASVRELAPVADPASRTYPMRLTLKGDTADLALGMSAVATGVGAGDQAIMLPITALFTLDAQPRVWIVDPATSTVRSVQVGTAGFDGDRVRVVSGIAAGDRVVTAGANMLFEGEKVRLTGTAE